MVSSPTSDYSSVQDDDVCLDSLRYQALLQQAEIALCSVSLAGTVDVATTHFCRIVTRSQQQVLGHKLWDVLNAANMVYDMEAERLVYVSPACAILLGRSASDFATRSWSDWMGEVHPADLESVLKVSRQLTRGTSSEVTYRLIPSDRMQSSRMRADSDVRWLMTRAVPVRNAAGRVCRILAATEDVTDRQKQNSWLRLLESVIVNANDAVVITEAEPVQHVGPHIVYVNQAFTRMLGYQPEEFVGQTPRILQGVNTDLETLAQIRSNLKEWKPVLVEIINYHKNGREVWIELLLFRRLGNGQGQIYSESVESEFPSLLGQEIEEADFFAEPVQLYERSTVQTLERLNEDHWQSRGADYLQALGVRSLMVIPISQQNRIWGWLIAHHTSHRHWSSFEVDLLQQLPAPLEVAITQGQLLQALQESEERFRTLANRAPVLLWSLDSHGQCVFCNQGLLDFFGLDMMAARGLGWLVAVHTGDRERVIAHHCLALQTRESHELEYRLRRSDGTYRWVLDRSVDTLSFHNMHLHNKNESGQEEYSLEKRPELPESLQILKEFGCSSIQFLSEPDQGLILANVDEKLMRQILMNLLTNAIKYSLPSHPIRFTLRATIDQLNLIVQDWGIGIPLADQERLFEPFHRAMNVKSIPGNGLGLAIVQQSVKVHQGHIKILSTLGEGTTVTVELPRWSTESLDLGS